MVVMATAFWPSIAQISRWRFSRALPRAARLRASTNRCGMNRVQNRAVSYSIRHIGDIWKYRYVRNRNTASKKTQTLNVEHVGRKMCSTSNRVLDRPMLSCLLHTSSLPLGCSCSFLICKGHCSFLNPVGTGLRNGQDDILVLVCEE